MVGDHCVGHGGEHLPSSSAKIEPWLMGDAPFPKPREMIRNIDLKLAIKVLGRLKILCFVFLRIFIKKMIEIFEVPSLRLSFRRGW
jgi:hypothetical protein